MATTIIARGADAPDTPLHDRVRGFASHTGYVLYEIAYQAKAARALLHEHPESEGDETLTGISYLLSRIADDCDRLSGEVNEQGWKLAGEVQHG
jgi:hypothetical protein